MEFFSWIELHDIIFYRFLLVFLFLNGGTFMKMWYLKLTFLIQNIKIRFSQNMIQLNYYNSFAYQ